MPYKLVCFDLDGTIVDNTKSIWATLHDALGSDKIIRQKAMDDYYAKRITYPEWAIHDVALWKSMGVVRTQIEKAMSHLRLMEGAEETIRALKKNGLKLGIISGSITLALEKVLPHYAEYFDDVFMNKILFDSKGGIEKVVPTPYDDEHKATALRVLCRREKIPLSSSVYIGDHDNDRYAAEIAGLSIGFNCESEKLRKNCKVVIEKKDLRLILPFILTQESMERIPKKNTRRR